MRFLVYRSEETNDVEKVARWIAEGYTVIPEGAIPVIDGKKEGKVARAPRKSTAPKPKAPARKKPGTKASQSNPKQKARRSGQSKPSSADGYLKPHWE